MDDTLYISTSCSSPEINQHLKDLFHLYREFQAIHGCITPPKLNTFKQYLSKLFSVHMLIRPDGHVVSFLGIELTRDGNIAYIRSFITDPVYKFQGYGRVLFNHTINFIEDELKIKKIRLEINLKQSSDGLSLFSSKGFVFQACTSLIETSSGEGKKRKMKEDEESQIMFKYGSN
jgi:GNAT superfamily N-acetyltransferase